MKNKIAYLLLVFLIIKTNLAKAQVTVNVTNPTNTTPNLAASYTSLATAITALDGITAISGPVTLTCAAGTETNPSGGYVINFTAVTSATNNVIIVGTGVTINAPSPAGTAGNLNDAIFKIIGSDFVTLEGFTMNENVANTTTTATTNNMVEWGVALLYASSTNGAQNCTILNNIITLNRTYQNTFGIYSNSTHTAATPSTSASATTAAGANSGIKIYGNNISNVNNGILILGPTAAADYNTGIDIGGTSSTQANSITNFGTTITFSTYGIFSSGSVSGIYVRNSIGYNVSYNTITSSVGGLASGALYGIQAPSAGVVVTGTFTNNINNNAISLKSGSLGSTGTMNGISIGVNGGAATSTMNINNNNFLDWGRTVASSGNITFIEQTNTYLNVNITGNTFTNLNVNSTGSVTFINHNYTMPAAGVQTISNNSIVTAFNKTGAGGTITISTSTGVSPDGSLHVFTNNNFSNITVTGATIITGVNNNDGNTGSPNRTVTGNTFSNWTGGTGAITGMRYSYIGATSTLSNNTFSNITGQGSITAINIGDLFGGGNPLTIANNTINTLTSSGAGGSVIGISSASPSLVVNINNNAISTLSSTAAAAVNGIAITIAGPVIKIFKNKICDLSGSNANSTVNGILVSTGVTVTLSNNRIGDLRTPAANAANPLNGINITAASNITINAYYNTVYLNGASTGALFGSSAISVNTTPTVTLRNNIFVNNSTTNGAAFTAAYRRSSTTLTTYSATSNNNLFYAGTPGATNVIFYNGTNNDQTLAAYKTRVAPRDAVSVTENPPFVSTAYVNPNFLKIDPSAPTQVKSGAAPIAGITDDFDGDLRHASAPGIGADEINASILPLYWLNISGSLNSSKQAVLSFKVNETNVTDYQIEKSSDARNFASIATIFSKGNGENSYQFTDAIAVEDIQYFRIKQRDIDGSFSYSPIIKLANQHICTLAIYPNPVKDMVSISNAKPNTIIILTDMSGKVLQQIMVTVSSLTIDMSNYANGLYLLKRLMALHKKLLKIRVNKQ